MTVHGFVYAIPSLSITGERSCAPGRIGSELRGLTVLLILQLCLVFVAAPLAAKGLPDSAADYRHNGFGGGGDRRHALAQMRRDCCDPTGVAAMLASTLLGSEWSPSAVSVLRHGGNILTFSALTWVLSHVVYAPGRITFHRLQGAGVLYLNLATIFASAFSLIWELNPAAFANLAPPTGGPGELATILYFSLTTLTTTGYGDIVAVDPFARSLANLESVIGQFYLAITVARLVTLELADRHR